MNLGIFGKGARMRKNIMLMSITAVVLLNVVGCQPTKSTSSKLKLWPILKATSSTTVNEDSSWSKTEKGDALLVIHWNNNKSCDSNGKITQREDNLEIWPILDCHSTQTDSQKTSCGSILLLKYDSREDK